MSGIFRQPMMRSITATAFAMMSRADLLSMMGKRPTVKIEAPVAKPRKHRVRIKAKTPGEKRTVRRKAQRLARRIERLNRKH